MFSVDVISILVYSVCVEIYCVIFGLNQTVMIIVNDIA